MRIYTITTDRLRRLTHPHGGKSPHYSKFDEWLCVQHRPWHEGITNDEADIWRPLLTRRYRETSGIRYWKAGDSYIIPTVVGAFCISRRHFHEHVLKEYEQ